MKAAEVEERARLGEDSRTEFKAISRETLLLNKDEAAKEICAFANSGGGELFAGIQDDGTIAGVGSPQQADRLIQQLSHICQQAIQPAVLCKFIKVQVGEALVVVTRVPGFDPDRPFKAGSRHFVRDGTVSREATRDELVKLLHSSVDVHFDEQPIEDAARDDLDPGAIQEFLALAYPGVPADRTDRYLAALRAVDPSGPPTVAGVLLFGRDPQRFLLDAYTTAIRFKGRSISSEFDDRQEIRGTVPDQLEQALAFLARHVRAPSVVEGLDRRELGLPVGALREAIANALTHRDYRAASQTRIFVFDDRVEVINPGALLNQLTLDGIRLGGVSQRRNPYLAAALARLNRRENAGIGVPEMIRLATERGLPEPEIILADGHFRVVLRSAPSPSS
jgi:ATP-dependent DNA helicase RecG